MGGASRILMLLSTPFPLLCLRSSSTSALRLSARHSRAAVSSVAGHHLHLHSPHFASRPRPKSLIRSQLHTQSAQREPLGDSPLSTSLPNSRGSASLTPLWPEWTKLLENLTAGGYSDRRSPAGVAPGDNGDDSLAVVEGVPEEFARAAEVCLAFARDRPDALSFLSKRNIEVVVENISPSLFKNGENSATRMRLFLNGDQTNVSESEKPGTIDVMRYILSYAYDSLGISEGMDHKDAEFVETSVRSLLTEFTSISGTVQGSTFAESTMNEASVSYEQSSRPPGQHIEMKRGDWICPKCTFMNFARNSRCLECEEARPKRQLTGGEWECPQCDFFNYGRNMSCLRCDCKRPAEIQSNTPYSKSSTLDQILSGSNKENSGIGQGLAANDEKAERWFSKVSQLGDKTDMNNSLADEDFPEIMPLRKGVNKFVVSTRKTPLERRLAKSQPGVSTGAASGSPSDSAISKTLDRILGRTPTPAAGGEAGTGAGSRSNSSDYSQGLAKSDPGYVPFVPLPPDMFKPQNSDSEVKADASGDSMTRSSTNTFESKNNNESSDASERWSRKVAELGDVTDLSSAIPDEDFPEIMPMRKGENRFVVSKKKDRSLTSPQYKRRLAMEQANKSDFVPFVPFPPGYFANKDQQADASSTSNSAASSESSVPPETVQAVPERQENKMEASNWVPLGARPQPESRTYGQNYNMPPQPASMTHNQSYNAPAQPASRNYSQSYNAPPQPVGKNYSQSYSAPPQHEHRSYGQSYSAPPQHEHRSYGQSYNTPIQPESWTYNQSYNKPGQPDNNAYVESYNAPPQSENRACSQRYNAPQKPENRAYSQSYNTPPQYENRAYGQSYNTPPQPENRAYGQSYNVPLQPENRAYGQSYNTPPQPENRAYGQSYSTPPQPDNRADGYSSSGNNLNESRVGVSNASSSSGISDMNSASNSISPPLGVTQESGTSQSTGQNWSKVFSGKSLEGSAVTDPDPLDMSEEAKAARWFRRAAQIKNISELSEIPDEDFPEIMPMRKGVNRFVVSKRKTPLERRLTSPQYRRNLPIVSSEPKKDSS